jgi:uncharacterized protein (TIGR02271 family)
MQGLGLDRGGNRTMSSSSYASQISVGDDVYGSDGDKVGTVADVQAGYIVVEKGFFFPTDYYIPMSAIASANDGQVYLNVARDAALNSGWNVVPDMQATTMTSEATATATGEEEIRIPVMEEELTATVRQQEAGAVRIEKDVISEERTLEMPVTEERVHVERRVVHRAATGADAGAFEETVIDVPLRSETVDIQKQARVTGEVVLSKEAVQRTERVTDTVRREEVHIDGDVDVIDDSEGSASRRG